jgi:hypothetical protein
MSLIPTVLFDMPQQEIASLIRPKLNSSVKTQIVAGFATPEGMEVLESALLANTSALEALVIGAGTYQSYEVLDQLISDGVPVQKLFVHLGHTRMTGGSAKYRFYRYHPMLHSKVYYMEHADGNASAIIGSHNVTGFALLGLNGEGAVLLEGPSNSPEFGKVRSHILSAIQQSVQYDPAMKDAYAWWTHEYILGVADKANDVPREGEFKRTIVILAELSPGKLPKKNDVVYFELPSALGRIQSLNAEVHIYLFDQLPATPSIGLSSLQTARTSLWCRTQGLELERGGVELQADWHFDSHRRPILRPVSPPFRPRPSSDMQQVRVRAYYQVKGSFEYLFSTPRATFVPVIDREHTLKPSVEYESVLRKDYRKPNPEDLEWYMVTGLQSEQLEDSEYEKALIALSPEGGSYVMVSLRRRVS